MIQEFINLERQLLTLRQLTMTCIVSTRNNSSAPFFCGREWTGFPTTTLALLLPAETSWFKHTCCKPCFLLPSLCICTVAFANSCQVQLTTRPIEILALCAITSIISRSYWPVAGTSRLCDLGMMASGIQVKIEWSQLQPLSLWFRKEPMHMQCTRV